MTIRKFRFKYSTLLLKILTGLLLFLFSSSFTYGQDSLIYNFYKPKKILKLAGNASQIGDLYSAIDLYEYYIKKDTSNIDAYYLLAENYRKARNYERAASFYKKVISKPENTINDAYYYLGDMLMQQAKYQEALEVFNEAKRKRISKELNYYLRQKIKGCEFALEAKPANEMVKIFHPDSSINRTNTELSPVFFDKNKIIFSSLRQDSIEFFPTKNNEIIVPVTKFYVAEKVDDTTWKYSGTWNFNDENMYVGNGAFSLNGNRFYFTKCMREWNNEIKCAIYFSDKDSTGDFWLPPGPLNAEINLPGYTTTQVTIGREAKRDKEIIYFVTDRPQGKGGLDIWYTIYTQENNTYSKPLNAGTRINTEGNEITPFYDLKSGTLFFSSDFHPGYGGYDVFSSKGGERRWTKPENSGKFINSENDELYYNLNPQNRKEGLFVSNRKGSYSVLHETCCDDIYFFLREKINKIYIKGIVLKDEFHADSMFAESDVISSLLLNLGSENIIIDSSMIDLILFNYDDSSEQKINIIPEAVVSIYLLDEENGEELFIYSDSTNEKGEYLHELEPFKNYKITFRKDEYFNQNLFVSTNLSEWTDTINLKDVTLKRIPRNPIKFTVYYDINSDKLKPESKEKIDTTLLTILNETPELIVEISSHTDSEGHEDYNQQLSQKRAEVVVKYLIEKGIDKNRLIAVGYGESRPVASNDAPDGRALNRRTEFKVVGSIDQFSKLNVTEMIIRRRNTQNIHNP